MKTATLLCSMLLLAAQEAPDLVVLSDQPVKAHKGSVLAFARESGRDVVHLWSFPSCKTMARFEPPAEFGSATALAFSPDGSTLVVGSGYGHIAVVDMESRKLRRYLTDPGVDTK